jgi:hypothetical protein
MFRPLACSVFAALLLATAQAQPHTTIRVWKVGSPHTGDIPPTDLPPALAKEVGSRGWRLTVDAFPAQGFAARFMAAASSGSAPDVVAFDNFGIIDGIRTGLGTFDGIGKDSVTRNQLIQVTDAFDELLGPARGWTFLFTSSANHAAARELALRTPRCSSRSSEHGLALDLPVAGIAAAYLAGDTSVILPHADPERLSGPRRNVEPVTVGQVAVCGGWGNDRLAFVTVNASYQADTKIGHASVLLVFRRTSSVWRLLVAARDPVSNSRFVAALPALSRMLERNAPADPLPIPASLRSPRNGRFPIPMKGARFGDFEWQPSASENVVADIVEFSYHDDARLVLVPAQNSRAPRRVSAGELWTTRGEWSWRIWSISVSGEVAFSEVRTFVH